MTRNHRGVKIMTKISILLPVYNSTTKAERSDLLQQMLASIVNQSYADFELLILDNQSEDNTVEICEAEAKKDGRIKVLADDERRSAEEATNKLLEMSTSEFIMVMSDDDLLHRDYLKILAKVAEVNKKTDLIYSNGLYIDIQNKVQGRLIGNANGIYSSDSPDENFYKAIHKRIVLPVLFGLFKKSTYQALMPNAPFDELRANMDNFLMAKFFLNKYKAAFVNTDLFYYRQRDRSLKAELLDYMPKNPILIWVYYVRHQLYFYNAVCDVINTTNQGECALALKITTLDSCLNQCLNLLNWVARDLAKDAFDHFMLSEIHRQYQPISGLALPCFSHTPELIKTHQDTMRLRCKILQERVMEPIKTMIQDIELVVDTQKVIKAIQKEILKQQNAQTHWL